jgi:hypothetical protein
VPKDLADNLNKRSKEICVMADAEYFEHAGFFNHLSPGGKREKKLSTTSGAERGAGACDPRSWMAAPTPFRAINQP